MEFTDQEKQILDLAQQLLWKKGANNPMEAQVASGLTQLAQKICTPQKPEEKK